MNLALSKLKHFSPHWLTLRRMGKALGWFFLLNPADETIRYKRALCLAIEKGEITVAVGSAFFSRPTITGVRRYPFPDAQFPPPSFLTSSLDLAVAELKGERKPITLSIPKSWAVIKTVEYPVTILENLAEVMAHELDRITPFTSEKAYYDFRVLNQGSERITILVAAARMDLIDPYLKALREKDYRVDGLTVNLLGLSTFARYYNKSDEGFIVEIDKDQYEGALSSSNAYFEALYGSFGNEAEHVKAERINNDLETSNTLSGQKIIHGGPLIILKDKSPTLKEAIKVRMHQAVSFLDDTHFGLGLGGKDLKPIPYEAVGGVLESIWIDSWKINLFKKGRHSESKPPWIITLLLLLVLGILIGIYWTTPIEIETKRLQHLDKQIALKRNEVKKVETLKKEIESVSTEINLINNFKQVKPLSINILRELTALLPKNAWLTRIRIFETQINIEGYAPSATSLIPRLEGSPLFKKIEYAAPTFKDTRQNMDRFQIKMELKNP